MYFSGIVVILQWTRVQTAKQTSLLNSGQLKTLGGAQKEKCHCSHAQYCLRYCSRHCSHRRIDDVALTDDVTLTDELSWSYWTKILMHCWSMTWQHISRPKISRTVHALYRIIFNQTASLFKPGQTMLLFKCTVLSMLLFTTLFT